MSLALRPTFSESWYRVVGLRPRLRPTAQISRQYYRGDRWYVVRDPAGNQFHRLSDPAYRFVGLLDGSRTVGEAWDLVGGQLADDAPTQSEVIQILSQLFAANLIETDVTPDSAVILKRQKMHFKRKMQQRLMNLLFPRMPLWDPDNFIKTWMPVIRLMLSWFGAVVWLAVVIGAIVVLAPMWPELQASTKDAIAPSNWAWLWVTFIVIKFIHEMGHAFSCRRFGGEVHEVGIMLLVLVPTPYVDASSAWAFPNKWKRVFVGAGGMIFELFVAAVCAFIWAQTRGSGSGQLINQLAYNTMLIASVSTIIFNANPLLRYDGYYILSDYWEIPNLQRKSSEYTLGLIKRHIFRVKQQQPLPAPWQRVQLFVYAIASSAYRIFVSLAIAYMLFYSLPEQLKIIGLLMGIGALTTFLLFPLFKLLKYLSTDPELHRKRARAWGFTGAVTAALVLLIGVINFPVAVRAEGVLEPAERRSIYTETPGFVEDVKVADGDWVKAGDVLMVLSNRQEQSQLDEQLIELQIVEKQITASLGNPPEHVVFTGRLQRLGFIADQQKDRVAKLIIRAPIDGRVVAPEIGNMKGAYLPPSQLIATITQQSQLEAFVVIDQADIARVGGDGKFSAQLRCVGAPNQVVDVDASRVKISPAAKKEVRSAALTHAGEGERVPDPNDPSARTLGDAQYEARILFDNNPDAGDSNASSSGAAQFYPGQRVYVRFVAAQSEPLATQWYRWFKQLTMQSTES
ncbi:MAG: HlyD family efflux transporter periplasmic adaptor subunit [Burkholderiales bacterium]|nr:HlyD family efflux transporter periplasmic adaptor subunit [Phycisphaerae bacterium]